ncbi:TonB-dependent receptor [Oceanobacter mangrovi]|uniref:TonB-dependent receptor n=1 Tax=Oceanobacter mangrovi TaxID=2862510 RepID=UPI001C8D4EA5|nr:TonB-dependent receptor [Oceanobacter mangrovi]
MNRIQTLSLPVSLAAASLLSAASHAEELTDPANNTQPMEEIVVQQQAPTASELNSPWMGQEELAGNRSKALGEVLESIPGVSNASFGQGVARPVVRGLSGNRVEILNSGSDAADLSSMSSDHAPMADLAAADGVELLRGPLALRRGNSSLGGVVNVLNGRIHDEEFDGTSGSVTAGYSSNNQGKTLIGRIDAGNGKNVLHLDGFKRETGNYTAGRGGSRSGEVLNSDADSLGAAVGYSHIFNMTDYVGVSVSHLASDYAIPNEDNNDVRVKPDQTRYDFKGSVSLPSSGLPGTGLNDYLFGGIFTDFSWHMNVSDYQHDEVTGSKVEGLFYQKFRDLQTELAWSSLSGWNGYIGLGANWRKLELCHDHSGCSSIPDYSQYEWDGSQGSDFLTYEGEEFAHDTPMPITKTRDIVAYASASGDLIIHDNYIGQLDLAARYQPRHIEADPSSIRPNYRQDIRYYDDKEYHPLTVSAALNVTASNDSSITVTLSRLQRAPVADELYWNGDHHATFSFQLDNNQLDTETAYAIDLSWQGHDTNNDWRIASYFYDYDGYIYNELQSYRDPYHGNHVYKHVQRDAQLAGLEVSWQHNLSSQWDTHFKAATTRGWLTSSGDSLPRMPADNLSQSLSWHYASGQVISEWQYHLPQTQLADAESRTPGWYQLNLAWHQQLGHGANAPQLDIRGNNLTDRYGQQHTSTLKEYAPVMGHNISLELAWPFG